MGKRDLKTNEHYYHHHNSTTSGSHHIGASTTTASNSYLNHHIKPKFGIGEILEVTKNCAFAEGVLVKVIGIDANLRRYLCTFDNIHIIPVPQAYLRKADGLQVLKRKARVGSEDAKIDDEDIST